MNTDETNKPESEAARGAGPELACSELGRPRRKAPSGLMAVIAATAAISGGLFAPSAASKGPREITDTDRWYLKRAEDRRARRLQKRIENQRRADAGKRSNVPVSHSGDAARRLAVVQRFYR